MESVPAHDVTALLEAWGDGDDGALDALMPLVYPELRRTARAFLRYERPGHTLQPTALAHEAFLRLVDQRSAHWDCRAQFYALSARLMRRILVDHARRRHARKRRPVRLSTDAELTRTHAAGIDLILVNDALLRLERLDPRQARIVELRYFGGMTVEETASVMELSPASVKREWRVARRWLHRELARA